MPVFTAADGTQLGFHRHGHGAPLICLPGGPMQASAYLGDLGGLAAHRRLLRLDLRGTGASDTPADPASYRYDRLVDDVEVLRLHLGLDRLELLGHSAGAAVVLAYAVRHPERVARLVLVTPSPRVVGLDVTDEDRRAVALLRRDEPWFPEAFAAFERIWAGAPTAADWSAITPFLWGRWDDAARAATAREATDRNDDAAALYYADDALDPAATRAALADLPAPVRLIAGEYDVALPPTTATAYTELFSHGELAVVAGAGHYPWIDDPQRFLAATLPGLSS